MFSESVAPPNLSPSSIAFNESNHIPQGIKGKIDQLRSDHIKVWEGIAEEGFKNFLSITLNYLSENQEKSHLVVEFLTQGKPLNYLPENLKKELLKAKDGTLNFYDYKQDFFKKYSGDLFSQGPASVPGSSLAYYELSVLYNELQKPKTAP